MKKVGISIAAIFVAASCTFGGIQAKKGIDNYIKKQAQEIVTQYEQEDRQWTKENFQEKVSLKQLQEAFNSTYLILNRIYYKEKLSEKGKTYLTEDTFAGSGILLKGNYILTAEHVVKQNPTNDYIPHYRKYDHNELSMSDEIPEEGKSTKEYSLEKIIQGSKEELDYALLKVRDDAKLPFYSYGLNMPDKIYEGIPTVAIGFPIRTGRNLRTGNISQTKSDLGEHYLTYKNNLSTGDSGGPLFTTEDGIISLTAISTQIKRTPHTNVLTSIDYGLKLSSIVKDLEGQLGSGNLDEKTVEEVKNFLELNKKH